MFDGTTVTMPDTPANQSEYPQLYNQKPGVGFPIAWIGALISLACGAVVHLGFARLRWQGPRRTDVGSPTVGYPSSQKCPAERSSDVELGSDRDAPTTRVRIGQSAQ
ncbi:MAG: hypothetical protein ACFCD0_17310 [Gemmataceae bacterium]